MHRPYRIIWTPVAQGDLASLINFIAQDSPQAAGKILRRIQAKASKLSRFPQRGRVIPELAHIPGLPFRELIITPWRLIYRIKPNHVDILACFDGRRDLEEVLFERLSRVP